MDMSLSISARLSAGHERRTERREDRREERQEVRQDRREVRREDRQETIAQWKTKIEQMLYTAAPTTPAPAVPAPDLPMTTDPVEGPADTPVALEPAISVTPGLPTGAYAAESCHSQPALAVA